MKVELLAGHFEVDWWASTVAVAPFVDQSAALIHIACVSDDTDLRKGS